MCFNKKILFQYFVVFCPALISSSSEKISHSVFLVLPLHGTKNQKNIYINHPWLFKLGKWNARHSVS